MKRYIALMMLVVYLFAVGAPAYAAVSCECVSMKARTEHRCCSHCNHDDSVTKGQNHYEAPCCGDHHSTDITLYTSSSQDGERQAKRLAVIVLPPAILTQAVVTLDYTPEFCGFVPAEGIQSVPESHVSSCGLRAPPVLV